jgi:predicted RNA polymerase sigma factor
LTEYHVEAAIAWVDAKAISTEETDWKHIVSLYELLMTIHPSPVVALNRAIAIGQHEGPIRGIEEICAIVDRDRLANYPFYFAALGEFEFRAGRYDISQEQFRKALAVARNQMEREFLQKRISSCERPHSMTISDTVASTASPRCCPSPRTSPSSGSTSAP